MTYAVNIAQGGSNNTTFRNRIINGAQIVDQRGSASSAVTVNSVTKAYATDRFCGTGIGSAGVFTLGQVTTAPSNFINSLKATVTTADASLAATDLYRVMHLIEGLNCADLGWGTATAQTVTLSFWVYSNLTGAFGGSLTNSAANRSYPFTFTISVANTWEQKTITVAGDTSGTWLTTSGIGIAINFGLGVGSTYSGTASAWAGAEYYSATGSTNVMATLSNTFYITGVQLEAGSTATPFEQRLYGTELALCQRYYVKTFPQATAPAQNAGNTGALEVFGQVANTAIVVNWMLPVEMRDTPSTVTTYSTNAASANWSTNTQTPTASIGSTGSKLISVRAGTSLAAGSVYQINATASAEL